MWFRNKRRVASCAAALIAITLGAQALAAVGTRDAPDNAPNAPFSVLVYITGVVAGSPPYELLVAGAESFAASHTNVRLKVYEAQFNQATWEEQLTSLVASGQYDLVLGSNPSLPEICANVAKKFPKQKFIITDAELAGHPQISTYLYNQYEQSLYLGYLAGLVTTSAMERANADKRIGFIAAQEYPLLNKQIVPGFLYGAQLVDAAITLDLRIIGNWFDATKAAELAGSMMDAGVDVFASIAGGAASGLIKVAGERGAYVVFHNTNEYKTAPGVIVGCGLMRQKQLVEEILADAIAGKTQYGSAKTVGLKEGYLDFIDDDPLYAASLPEGVRSAFAAFMKDLRAGKVAYTVPSLN
ncbi:MAG: BMP family ABC transporter substrate-binding protein [Treponema sp.]|jgi:simple sugar transport system substrate-binding protein|nr:BMP family ABC transporter substrate-binding protein [Treponema sp.]